MYLNTLLVTLDCGRGEVLSHQFWSSDGYWPAPGLKWIRLLMTLVVVVVVLLPRPMEGIGWLQFSDLFTEYIYHSEHYGLNFGGCHIIFTRSALFNLFVYISIPPPRMYTLHVCYVFNVIWRIRLMTDGLSLI